jgi:hypothetical protein
MISTKGDVLAFNGSFTHQVNKSMDPNKEGAKVHQPSQHRPSTSALVSADNQPQERDQKEQH